MEGDLQRIAGLHLRAYREARGLSQEAFADVLGVHRTYVGGLERGERNLTLKSLERIAARLELDPLSLPLYLRAKPHVRRLMNQAIFEAIWVWDEDEVRSQVASPFKEVIEIDAEIKKTIDGIKARRRTAAQRPPDGPGAPEKDEAAHPWPESGDFATGSIRTAMVGAAGFEPATSRV
jgi:transcriptional regulator with XRE-family HTH domain